MFRRQPKSSQANNGNGSANHYANDNSIAITDDTSSSSSSIIDVDIDADTLILTSESCTANNNTNNNTSNKYVHGHCSPLSSLVVDDHGTKNSLHQPHHHHYHRHHYARKMMKKKLTQSRLFNSVSLSSSSILLQSLFSRQKILLIAIVILICIASLSPFFFLRNTKQQIIHEQQGLLQQLQQQQIKRQDKYEDNDLTIQDLECGLNSNNKNNNTSISISSIRCPLGKDTSGEYQDNMLSLWYKFKNNHHRRHTSTNNNAIKNDKKYNNYYGNTHPIDSATAVINNKELFLKCANYPLPYHDHDNGDFNPNTPTTPKEKECWPRFIILASHATSGNGLFRSLIENITGMHIGMSHYEEGASTALFNLVLPGNNHRRDDNDHDPEERKLGHGNGDSNSSITVVANNKNDPFTINAILKEEHTTTTTKKKHRLKQQQHHLKSQDDQLLQIYGNLNQSLPLPFTNRNAILFKSHISQSADKPRRSQKKQLLTSAISNDKLHAILRMARNPGDQILRNNFRWKDKSCYKEGDACFYERAKLMCPKLARMARGSYGAFHSFWNEFGGLDYYNLDGEGDGGSNRSTSLAKTTIPQMVVHYEHFSMADTVEETIREVLRFVDTVKEPGLDYVNFLAKDSIDQMKSIINEPIYEHGTLVAKVCGKDVARSVHRVTKQYSEPLGYEFDDDEATWTLSKTSSYHALYY